jgi:hypothetical protein
VRIQSQAFFLEKAMNLKPKNWDKFQHYKDRCPPWIKLHRDLLNDRAFMGLPLASKALAPLLWLLASESKDGCFQADSAELEFRLRIASKDIDAGLKPLIDKGFFVIASGVLAERLQDAIPETETEKEAETEKKPVIEIPDWLPKKVWKDWCDYRRSGKNKFTDRAQILCLGALETLRNQGHDPETVINLSIQNGWTGLFPPKNVPAAEKATAMPAWAAKRATSA